VNPKQRKSGKEFSTRAEYVRILGRIGWTRLNMLKYTCDVEATGVHVRVGVAGPDSFGPDGGVQIELQEPGAVYKNPRPL